MAEPKFFDVLTHIAEQLEVGKSLAVEWVGPMRAAFPLLVHLVRAYHDRDEADREMEAALAALRARPPQGLMGTTDRQDDAEAVRKRHGRAMLARMDANARAQLFRVRLGLVEPEQPLTPEEIALAQRMSDLDTFPGVGGIVAHRMNRKVEEQPTRAELVKQLEEERARVASLSDVHERMLSVVRASATERAAKLVEADAAQCRKDGVEPQIAWALDRLAAQIREDKDR